MGLRGMSWAGNGSLLSIARALSRDWTRAHWRILCYHSVQREEKESFRQQLEWFAERFTFCTVSEGAQLIANGALSGPMLSVTFDDGDRTVYDVALPVLEFYRVKATLYATADYIVRGHVYRDSDAPSILPEQLRDWVARGHEVGSHGLTHAPMSLCSPERFEQEARLSKAILEDMVSQPVVHFSYPWGQHNRWTLGRLRRLGVYRTAATIHRGAMTAGQQLLRLRRDVIYPRMSVQEVETIMRLADKFYWLRYLRRRPDGYWRRHPETAWEELEAGPPMGAVGAEGQDVC